MTSLRFEKKAKNAVVFLCAEECMACVDCRRDQREPTFRRLQVESRSRGGIVRRWAFHDNVRVDGSNSCRWKMFAANSNQHQSCKTGADEIST